MNTPICDFVARYAAAQPLRAHMPGHKGIPLLGMEGLDITEIHGADSLYEACGIIAQSEANASFLFGCPTFYSTEGASQCIRAMLRLSWQKVGRKPVIAAGRNAHKAFLSAAALLDLQVKWLYPENPDSYLSCPLDAQALDRFLAKEAADAVYVTSPDYLGNLLDIAALAKVAHRHGCLLLVDNAHGAYLRFLPRSLHPMDLGADLCCDSAHKTLTALTGGAYLHIRDEGLALHAKNALALFGSTSPSYLILQSLDRANAYLADGYREKLAAFCSRMDALRQALNRSGYDLRGNEPMRLTVEAKPYGYTGCRLAQLLLEQNIVCEFSDPDFLVLMLTPETGEEGLARLEQALLSIPRKAPVNQKPPAFRPCEKVLSIREATLAAQATVAAKKSMGKVLASPCVGCPPAVPIVICGEKIDEAAIACFAYYGIDSCAVVAE